MLVVERQVGVRLELVQHASEGEQRGGLQGLLARFDPQGVQDVELIGEGQVGQP